MDSNRRPLEEMELKVDELETLSQLLHAFSQRTRLAILLGLYHDFSPPEIADALDVSRPGLQGHLDQMKEQRLIHRDGSGQYQLTPLGEYFADWIESQRNQLLNIVEHLDQVEEETEAELEDTLSQQSLSDQEWQRLVAAQVWEKASEPVKEQLGTSSTESGSPSLQSVGSIDLGGLEKDVSVYQFPADRDDEASSELLMGLKEQGILEDEKPLYEVVDPAALDDIFEDSASLDRNGLVAFEYQGQVIVIGFGSDGDIEELVDDVASDEELEDDT